MMNGKSIRDTKYIIPVFLGVFFIFLCFFYYNPQIIMTDNAKRLIESGQLTEKVEQENTTRGDILKIGGGIFLILTLWQSFLQLEVEKNKERKSKLQEAYIEWADALCEASKIEILRARYKKNKEETKRKEVQEQYNNYHYIRRKARQKILMFETRKDIIKVLKEIEKYLYPHYPIMKNIDKKQKLRIEKKLNEYNFWENESIMGNFYGITFEMIDNFILWLSSNSNPNPKDFVIPNFIDYLNCIKDNLSKYEDEPHLITNTVDNIIKKIGSDSHIVK